MREIKFRVYNKSKNKMEEVSQINFATKSIVTTENNCYMLCDCELMQYTGLTDGNDKEIYEGDIVKIKNVSYHIGKIVYDEEYMQYVVEVNEMVEITISVCYGDFNELYIEVIGNIYDNPELLEEKYE